MNVTEILQLADHLVLSQSRKHLSDLQKAVLLGVCQGEDYKEIAIKVGKSEEYIKNTAYKLWKILSKSLGENVNKFNLKSTIERLSFSIKVFNDNDFKDVNINNNFNICPDRTQLQYITYSITSTKYNPTPKRLNHSPYHKSILRTHHRITNPGKLYSQLPNSISCPIRNNWNR